MTSKNQNINNIQFLIIGSGIAGLSFALKAAQVGQVMIVTKNAASETNTRFAQGGIACVMNADDDLEMHVQDTLEAGAGLCNEDAVRIMVNEARPCINDLIRMGVMFSQSNSQFELGLEGGHTRNRIAHVKDFTGREIETVLLSAVRNNTNITILENHMAIDIVNEAFVKGMPFKKRCLGAEILNECTGGIRTVYADYTVLCTGGAGQVYNHTTNPSIATGDGVAMAYRAGAGIKDMEFVQFHPTALYYPGAPVFLISEALRGAGAVLKDIWGNTFMEKYHPLGSLAPRDITSRAIYREMQDSGSNHVYLDATHIPAEKLIGLFPNIYENCLKLGINITSKKIPVVPSAHFMCGGIATDTNGQTDISCLYAFGEVACTGVHGANRLASNSLLEAMVFSNRAFEDIKKNMGNFEIEYKSRIINSDTDILPSEVPDKNLVFDLFHKIKQLMSQSTGITRNLKDLTNALDEVAKIEITAGKLFIKQKNSREVIELYNLAIVARIIIFAALGRKKSVGAHYVTDESSVFISENEKRKMGKFSMPVKTLA